MGAGEECYIDRPDPVAFGPDPVAFVVAVKPGNQVQFEEGAIMKNFYSQQLLRTFPEVMFVGEITVAAEK